MLQDLSIGGLSIGWYLLCAVLATVAGSAFFIIYGRRENLLGSARRRWLFCACVAFMGIVGARIWSIASVAWMSEDLGSLATYFETRSLVEATRGGGLVWFGGFVPVLLWVLALRSRLTSERFWRLFDVAAMMGCLAQAIARVGCFLGGCCFGKWTDLPWGVIVPHGTDFSLMPKHPTNLYASLGHFILFALLLRLDRRRPFAGAAALGLLIGHGVIRFLNQLVRVHPDVAVDLTSRQWISLGLIGFGVAAWWWRARSARAGHSPAPIGQPSREPRGLVLVGSAAVVFALFVGSFLAVDTALARRDGTPLAERLHLKTLDGDAFDLRAPADQTLLLNVWASWCGPCRTEIPELNQLARLRPDVLILGVNAEEPIEVVRRAAASLEIAYPVLSADRSDMRKLGGFALPRTLLLDDAGRVRRVWTGAVTAEEILAELPERP